MAAPFSASPSDLRSGIRTPAATTHTSESKQSGFRTSEFFVMLLAVAGVLIATYNNSLSRSEGWRYATFVAISYIVSRGLAKLGTRTDHHHA
jgi:hypothetical protein